MSKLVYLRDRFVQEDIATISHLDLCFQRGYGVFDFFRLVGDHPMHWEDHLNRFYFSAEQMRLPVPKSRGEIKQVIHELIWENELPDSGIRIQLTGGNYIDGGGFDAPTLIISQLEFPSPTAAMRENGIRLISYEHQRQLPQVKTTDYMMAIWLQPHLEEQGGNDILYHRNGFITECPRSNFFIVTQDEKLVTPRDQILKGITRMKVLKLAPEIYATEEREVHLEEVYAAREAFITSTTKQIVPVTQIDGRKIADGSPGIATKRLADQLRAYCGLK